MTTSARGYKKSVLRRRIPFNDGKCGFLRALRLVEMTGGGREVAAFGDGDCHADLRAVEDAGPYIHNDR